jgi:hypothetical protein
VPELRSIGLSDVALAATRQAIRECRVALPGSIQSYDAGTQKATVQPLLFDAWVDEDGERRSAALPPVTNVPVVFPGAGGFRLTFPVNPGDNCLLIFSDRSLDAWLSQGGLVDPLDPRMHDKTDGIALVGLRDFGHPLTGARGDAMTLGKDGGTQIHVESGHVRLGGQGATEPVVLGNAYKTALTTFLQALNTFAVAANAGAAPALATAATAFLNAAFLSTVSSSL